MPLEQSNDWSKLIAETRRLQQSLANKVISRDDFEAASISTACGFDASYLGAIAYCSSVVVRLNLESPENFDVIETVDNQVTCNRPYIPGMFLLREGEPAIKTIKKVKAKFDVLLVDGHGVLHPRKCGLASYIGLLLDKPTIGVAKRLLCGTQQQDGFIEHDGQILGFAMGSKKKVYVSVGHRISLNSAISVVRKFTKQNEWYPEPLRLADARSKMSRKKSKNRGRTQT